MIAEISAAFASAKIALDIAKAAHGLTNYNELVAAVSEVNAKLVDAIVVTLASLEKQSALTSENADLKEKLRKLDRFALEAERYILDKLPLGGFVFSMKKGGENGQPPHYLCATCMNKGEITILQPEGDLFISCPLGHSRVQVMAPNNGLNVYPENH